MNLQLQKKEDYDSIKVGDTVISESFTSMGSGGSSVVTDIYPQYDPKTGEPFRVIACGSHKWNGSTGNAMDGSFYYLASYTAKNVK